jgi:CubicO group peptidase (beta-lactamase class C family)
VEGLSRKTVPGFRRPVPAAAIAAVAVLALSRSPAADPPERVRSGRYPPEDPAPGGDRGLAGRYRLIGDSDIVVVEGKGRITLTISRGPAVALEAGGRNSYCAPALGARVSFSRDDGGRAARLTVTRFGETVSAPRVEGGGAAVGTGTPPSSIPEAIDAMAPRLMIAHHVPGVAVAGIEGRRVAWHREYGVRRAGDETRVKQETVFEACSMTKPVFAYVVLKLVEEGKLALDRPLVEYLKALYLPGEPRHRAITARMILSHTSGFPNWREGGWQAGGPLPVLFEPGSKFGYSGEGYLYLQRVVESITGAPLKRYMREALLDPIGMTASSFAYEDRHEGIAAHGHDDRGEPQKSRRLFREANAGYSLHTTAVEYARFLVEMMREDRAAAHSLSGRSVEAMLSAAVEATDRKPVARGGKRGAGPVRWGLGWAIDGTGGGDRIYHGGANGTGFRCYSEFDPRRGTGIVIMTNATGGRALWEKLIEAVSPP